MEETLRGRVVGRAHLQVEGSTHPRPRRCVGIGEQRVLFVAITIGHHAVMCDGLCGGPRNAQYHTAKECGGCGRRLVVDVHVVDHRRVTIVVLHIGDIDLTAHRGIAAASTERSEADGHETVGDIERRGHVGERGTGQRTATSDESDRGARPLHGGSAYHRYATKGDVATRVDGTRTTEVRDDRYRECRNARRITGDVALSARIDDRVDVPHLHSEVGERATDVEVHLEGAYARWDRKDGQGRRTGLCVDGVDDEGISRVEDVGCSEVQARAQVVGFAHVGGAKTGKLHIQLGA